MENQTALHVRGATPDDLPVATLRLKLRGTLGRDHVEVPVVVDDLGAAADVPRTIAGASSLPGDASSISSGAKSSRSSASRSSPAHRPSSRPAGSRWEHARALLGAPPFRRRGHRPRPAHRCCDRSRLLLTTRPTDNAGHSVSNGLLLSMEEGTPARECCYARNSPTLKIRLGRSKDHQELEVLDDVDERCLASLVTKAIDPGSTACRFPSTSSSARPAST